MRILVLGGTGFIGRHLAARLVAGGHAVYVPTRSYQKGRELLLLPTVELFDGDVHDDADLNSMVGQSDAVINLVGILHGNRGRPYGSDFKKVHVDLPRRIARICRARGVERLLHVSALGAGSDAPSGYLRSKAAGEQAIKAEFAGYGEGSYTIFRPSVVFGPEDRFMNVFARLARWMPVIFLAGAGSRLQPVYVGDVSQVMADALTNVNTFNGIYTLAGSRVYTLGELVSLAALWSGHPRPVVPLPGPLGRQQALLLELMPGTPLMSRDNLDSLQADGISDSPIAPELGIVPTPLESVAPRYLNAPH